MSDIESIPSTTGLQYESEDIHLHSDLSEDFLLKYIHEKSNTSTANESSQNYAGDNQIA